MNTTARIEHSSTPDAEFRYFVYCPNDGDFTYYKSAAERDKGADMVIQRYLDDGWDEMVEQVVAGELTHTCGQVGREDRPPRASWTPSSVTRTASTGASGTTPVITT